jgi:coenzyme Q-binding protein COQ10
MPTFTTRRRVPYTPRQMYDLVADVERYPQFLPLTEGLRIRTREKAGPPEVFTADMTVGYKAIRETFLTRVSLYPEVPKVEACYIDGPFQRLENRWNFHAVPGGCEIDFYIDYEFKSRMLGMLVGAMFDQAFRRFAEAFEARARVVYGQPSVAAL